MAAVLTCYDLLPEIDNNGDNILPEVEYTSGVMR